MNKLKQNVTKGKVSSEVFQETNWIVNFATLSKQKSLIRLTLLAIITIFLCFQIPKLRFNYDFDSFFPRGDEDLAYYEMLNEKFGEYNNFLFVVSKHTNPLSEQSLSQISSTIKQLETWSEIKSIDSPLSAQKIQITPFGINTINLITTKGASVSTVQKNGLVGKFFGRDGKSTMLIIRHEAFDEKKEADLFFRKLSDYLEKALNQNHLISGKIQMQHDFTLKLENELSRMLILSLLFVVTLLTLLFRSTKGVIIPMLTLLITLVWTMGFLALTGKPIDIMVVIIPSILLIVALSDVIHFVHKFDDLRATGMNKTEAIKATILFIGKATCLTSITTCIGFLSLFAIPIQPIQDFGLYTAIGVLFAFVVTFLLIPSLFFFFSRPIEKPNLKLPLWGNFMGQCFVKLVKRRKPIVGIIGIVSLVLISGVTDLRLNTSIIVGFQKNEPELTQVNYFDQNFDGYKPFEMGIKVATNHDITELSVLREIEKIEQYLRNSHGVAQIESPLSLIRTVNSGIHGASENHYVIPDSKDSKRVSQLYYSPRLRTTRSLFQSTDKSIARIIGRSQDIGSAESSVLNKKLNSFLTNNIDNTLIEAKLTGTSYLIDKTDNYVVWSLIKGLGIAAISVSLCLFLFFRHWQIILFSLIPNLTPIAILFGLMGIFQIDLNISTAVVFTVAFGIAVDDSIHLIARYYLEKQQHKTPLLALKRAFIGTGKSIIVTSLVILSGFSLFMTSGLSSPFYLGLFIVLTTVIALILDLTILPLLILKTSRKN